MAISSRYIILSYSLPTPSKLRAWGLGRYVFPWPCFNGLRAFAALEGIKLTWYVAENMNKYQGAM